MEYDDQRMTDDDLVSALRADVDDAVAFIDSDIAPDRAAATRFYLGEPFGDEEDGRSQVVMPVLRDAVRATMPSLMRIFFGGRRVVDFIGLNEQSAADADLMTEAVQYVFTRQNPGFMVCWDAFKDALTRKVGFITWWWDDSVEVKARTFDGVTSEQLDAANATLENDEELEVVSATQVGQDELGQPLYTYKIRIIGRKKRGQVRVEAVPPEELIIDRYARSIHHPSTRLVGLRTEKTRGELVAMGVSPDVLDAAGGPQGGQHSLQTNQERLARQPAGQLQQISSGTRDQDKFLYCALFYRVDFDGDGISELRRIVTVGDGHTVISNEYADEVTIAGFCPDPEPHVVFGLGYFENLHDMQVIESHVTRDMLDSLKASIFPRTVAVEGQVNIDDVLNTEIGAAIRERQPGMVRTLDTPFVGQQALPILEWMDAIKERRTGVRGSSPMLDAKALQSTNQVAVNAAVTGAQAQVELIARVFAETGMKQVMRGILKMLVENQRVPLSIVVDGQAQKVDPTKWDIDVEVEVDAGLGTGQNEAKIALIKEISDAQTATLQVLGMENPLVDLTHVYQAQRRLLELHGMRDVSRFWRDPSTYEAPPPQPPEPTAEQVLAEAQMQISAGELDVKQLQLVLDDDFRRDELDAKIAIDAAKINAQYKTQVDVASIKALLDRKRLTQEAQQHEDALVAAAASPGDKGAGQEQRKKVTKRAIRDDSGRIQAVEELEEVAPRKILKKAIRDESGRITSVEAEEV